MKLQTIASAKANLINRLVHYLRSLPSIPLRLTLLLLALLAWGEFLTHIAWKAAFVDFWRQPAAWVAAKLVTEGRADVLYADGRIFGAESVRLGANPDIFAANAPTAILPYLPLTPFSVNMAHMIWVVFSIVCFVLALVFLIRTLQLPWPLVLLIWIVAPMFQPWRRNIYLGEAYAPILLLTVLGSIWAAQGEHLSAGGGSLRGIWSKIGAGCAFALSCIVRQFYGLMSLITPFYRRQWLVFITALTGYAAAALLVLVWLGSDSWIKSIQFSISWREDPATAITAYQSLNDFLTHVFRYHATLNPEPIVDWPWIVAPLWLVASICVLGLTIWTAWPSENSQSQESTAMRLLPYASMSSVALLISPISEDYHYTQLLFPIIVSAALLWEASHTKLERMSSLGKPLMVLWVLLLISTALLAPPYKFYNISDTGGWRGLIFYPRFFGNTLLWLLTIFTAKYTSHNFRFIRRSTEKRS